MIHIHKGQYLGACTIKENSDRFILLYSLKQLHIHTASNVLKMDTRICGK